MATVIVPKSAEKTRFIILMENASRLFRDLSDPFNHSELVRLNVTSDEVFDLSTGVANAIDFYLKHREQAIDERAVEAVREVMGDAIAERFKLTIEAKRAEKKLEDWRASKSE